MLRIILFFLLAMSVTIWGCSDDDDDNGELTRLALEFTGLETLENGYHYEGWAILSGPVSTGKFNIGTGGEIENLDGTTVTGGIFEAGTDLSAANAIVITIEPSGDTDDIPADTKYLGGDVSGATADLAIDHSSSLGDDFVSASGVYILATPTNGDATNENSGIWFLDLSSGSPVVGLDLPVLPTGWAYEGWAVISGTPVTTGRFTDVAAVDLDDPFSGTQFAGPPFPGEDFLMNAPSGLSFPTDLAGATAVISIEPEPDSDPAPFTLKPLVGMIPTDATDHVTYTMDLNTASFPTGTATIMQ